MATAHTTAEATAREAMRRWISGARGGDWSGLVEMLHPEVIFHVPVEGFAGPRHGVAEARRFFDHLAVAVRAQLTVTAVLTDGQRFGFEVAVAGLWLDRPFRQGLCLVFVPADDVVKKFGEYLAWPGGLDPQTVHFGENRLG
jgi:hypothetical protein